jgi:hypothetical protein
MFTKRLTALLFLCIGLFIFNLNAQETSEPTTVSNVADTTLPWGAQRILPDKIPAEFNDAFEKLLTEGNGKITGGNREVLAWEGNYKNKTNEIKFKNELQTNFRKEGWQYEAVGKDGDVEFFSLLKESSPRRAVLGFLVSGSEIMVCALMEVKNAGETVSNDTKIDLPITNNGKNDLSIYGRWFRTVGGSSIDYTGKTKLKAGEDFTFEFFADGSVEYTRKKEVLSIMQCHIKESQNARGKFSISGNILTINLGAMKSVGTNSCDAKGNFNKTLENSTMTVRFEIKQMEDITRPDKPTIMCFDGSEVCYERQK